MTLVTADVNASGARNAGPTALDAADDLTIRTTPTTRTRTRATLDVATCDTPLGAVTLFADGAALVGLEFSDRAARVSGLHLHLERSLGPFTTRAHDDPAGAATRLRAYFAGDLDALDHQRVEFHGTPFRCRVWRALREIPRGRTESYGALAARIGAPHAQRTVGAANGGNPIALFVPCHRVIAADGTLHGYGGGLERKAWLLTHEGAWGGGLRLL